MGIAARRFLLGSRAEHQHSISFITYWFPEMREWNKHPSHIALIKWGLVLFCSRVLPTCCRHPTATAFVHFSPPSVTVSAALDVGGFLEGTSTLIPARVTTATPSSRDVPSGDSAGRWSAAQRLVTLPCQHLRPAHVGKRGTSGHSSLRSPHQAGLKNLFAFGRAIKVLAKTVG